MEYENYQNISFARVDGILTVTLNRPDALNATDERLHWELSRVFADIARDRETRAVILTGAGQAFCAGGDLKHGLSMNRAQTDAMVEEGRKIIMDILEVPQPIIAAVNGYAMGLGATLALFSDIVIASEDTTRDAVFVSKLFGGEIVPGCAEGLRVLCGSDQEVLIVSPEAVAERDPNWRGGKRHAGADG